MAALTDFEIWILDSAIIFLRKVADRRLQILDSGFSSLMGPAHQSILILNSGFSFKTPKILDNALEF